MYPITEEVLDDPWFWCSTHAMPTDESCCCPRCEEDTEFDLMLPDSLGG